MGLDASFEEVVGSELGTSFFLTISCAVRRGGSQPTSASTPSASNPIWDFMVPPIAVKVDGENAISALSSAGQPRASEVWLNDSTFPSRMRS